VPHAPSPSGIGGWLIPVAAGLAATPVWIGYVTWSTFGPLIDGGMTAALDAVGANPNLGPALKWLIVAELAANTGLLLMALWSIVLLIQRHRWFPAALIGTTVLSFVIVLGDSLIAHRIGLSADGLAIWDILRNGVTMVVVVPYALLSKRVRNTFVE
jgi:hypothetical protein